MKTNKTLAVFLLCHLIIWSILPIVLRPNLPMDSAEALIWGFIGEWGTNKHPPLSGWFAAIFYDIFAHPASLYVLSQLFIIGGLFYVYKLGKLFLSEEKALVSALVLEAVAYYSLVTPEYNVNIIALMLWPAATYYFARAMREDKLYFWFMFGVFAGLNMINKYVSGILFICLGAYIICTKEGRAALKSWKLYFAAMVAALLIAPHIWWLYEHDWFVIDYFLSRSGDGKVMPYGLAHIVYPIKFIGSQIMTSALALIILFVAYKKSPKEEIFVKSSDRKLIFFAGVLPVLLMAAISLVLGIKLRSMWGSPVMYMLGICFFTWLPFDIKPQYQALIRSCYGALLAFALAFCLQCLFTDSAKFNLDAKDFTSAVKGNNYAYVGGSVWLASTIGSYADNHPSVLFMMTPQTNPWIDMADVKKQGILVVEENLWTYRQYQKNFTNLPEPDIYLLKVETPTGKVKEYPLYYGTIAGENK